MSLPFKGISAGRPYPPTGLTTARWIAEVPVEVVPLARLYLTQPGVDIAALFGLSEHISDRYPHVVAWDGELYLEDGHTRVVRVAMVYVNTDLGAHAQIHARVFRRDQP